MKEKIIFNLKLAQIYAKDSDMEVALRLTRETITLLERLCNIRKDIAGRLREKTTIPPKPPRL